MGLGMSPAESAEIFRKWNTGPLDSYLIEITGHVLDAIDTETGKPLVELIVDKAGQKGTGRWSAIAGQDMGVPATAIEGAVAARSISALKDERIAAEKLYGKPAYGKSDISLDDLEMALLAGKIVSYAQGLCRAAKGFRGKRLEPAAGDHRQDLAGRLHHPLEIPRPDVGGL